MSCDFKEIVACRTGCSSIGTNFGENLWADVIRIFDLSYAFVKIIIADESR